MDSQKLSKLEFILMIAHDFVYLHETFFSMQ